MPVKMSVKRQSKRTVKMPWENDSENVGEKDSENVSKKTVKEDSENAVGKDSEKDGGNVSERTVRKDSAVRMSVKRRAKKTVRRRYTSENDISE